MAEISGHSGAVAIAGDTINFIRNWSMDYEVAMLDSTSFADTFNEFIPGIKSWSGSFEALVDGATAPAAGARAAPVSSIQARSTCPACSPVAGLWTRPTFPDVPSPAQPLIRWWKRSTVGSLCSR